VVPQSAVCPLKLWLCTPLHLLAARVLSDSCFDPTWFMLRENSLGSLYVGAGHLSNCIWSRPYVEQIGCVVLPMHCKFHWHGKPHKFKNRTFIVTSIAARYRYAAACFQLNNSPIVCLRMSSDDRQTKPSEQDRPFINYISQHIALQIVFTTIVLWFGWAVDSSGEPQALWELQEKESRVLEH